MTVVDHLRQRRNLMVKCLPAALMLAMTGLKAQSVTAPTEDVGAPSGPSLDSTPKKSFSFVPRATIAETFTNNANLTNKSPMSDQITDISVGLRATSDGPRLKAYFDYSLREL